MSSVGSNEKGTMYSRKGRTTIMIASNNDEIQELLDLLIL